MSFGRSDAFSAMINEHLPYDLLKNELFGDDLLLKKIEIKEGWLDGATLPVPFKEASASSVVYGELENENDIAQSVLEKGSLSAHKTITSSLRFAHRDLQDHKGGVSKKSFLKLLPNELEDHLKLLRGLMVNNFLNGVKLAVIKGTIDDAANGILPVNNPQKLKLNMKLDFYVNEADATATTVYVKEIDIAARKVLFVTTRGGTTPVDFTAVGQVAAVDSFVTLPKAKGKGFVSIKDMLLPAAQGGAAQIAGKTKTSFSYLQAYAKSGSNITVTSILGPLFDMQTEICTYTPAEPKEIWMSYKNLGTALKEIEKSKGAYNIVPNSRNTSVYGYDTVEIGSVAGGTIKLVGIKIMDDDFIAYMDNGVLDFHTDSFIRRIKSPDGNEYYTTRTVNGYFHIIDHECHGDLILSKPNGCGVLHSISY